MGRLAPGELKLAEIAHRRIKDAGRLVTHEELSRTLYGTATLSGKTKDRLRKVIHDARDLCGDCPADRYQIVTRNGLGWEWRPRQ